MNNVVPAGQKVSPARRTCARVARTRMNAIVSAPLMPIEPARSFRAIVHNCDKDVPLLSGDSRFVDLSLGRGDQVTEMIVRDICDQYAGAFTHIALVSHRGAGKSTEIHQIESRTAERFQSIYLEATVEMDANQIEIEDLLLNVAMAVEKEMRRLGKPIPRELLDRIEKWFAEIVKSTKWATNYNAEIAAGIDIGANTFVLTRQALVRLLEIDRVHVGAVLVAQGFHHAADRALHKVFHLGFIDIVLLHLRQHLGKRPQFLIGFGRVSGPFQPLFQDQADA